MAGVHFPNVPSKYDCPNVCPTRGQDGKKVEFKKAAELRQDLNLAASPYVPGRVLPPEPTVYPPGAPPPYMPQATDSTSGDFLQMGPIDPWAPGHMDWSPQAGMTGTRPVVDRYSITRYSTGEWRQHNKFMLAAHTTEKGRELNKVCREELKQAWQDIDKKADDTNKMLDKRIKDLSKWKKRVENCLKGITDEVTALEKDQARLKKASRILMLPEAISRECLELRTHRYEPDQVRDNAEQELIREVAIVGEIRRVFNETLRKVEEQLKEDRFAKAAIERDWSDKLVSLLGDKLNREMTYQSSHILQHPGVNRWTENSTTLEYWLHYCAESIRNTDEVRKKSENLRDDLMTAIVKGGQDMKVQCDRTNMALGETISATEALCEKLEETLKDNLERIADTEKLLDYLKDSLRKLDQRSKLCMTRLHSRNYERPNVENCKDEAQYGLMDETKFTREKADEFKDRVRQVDLVKAELMKFRGDLEKEIACKRKALNIDRDRLSRIRAHMPSAETFASI